MRHHLLIVDTGTRGFVLPIDEVNDVVDLDAAALAGDELTANSRAPFLGVLRLADGLVWIHDVDRLFSSADAFAFDRALDTAFDRADAC